MDNHYRPWLLEDEELLVSYVLQGQKSYEEIGSILGRTSFACRSKISQIRNEPNDSQKEMSWMLKDVHEINDVPQVAGNHENLKELIGKSVMKALRLCFIKEVLITCNGAIYLKLSEHGVISYVFYEDFAGSIIEKVIS